MPGGRKILVLGGGAIGSAIARDLAGQQRWDVTVADIDPAALRHLETRGVRTVAADLVQSHAVAGLAAEHDLVVGALPSAIGYQTLRTVIEAGRSSVDVSFMPENALELDALARQRGVTAVVDCGLAPGLSHMLAGYAASRLAPCERITIHVGGLPVERRWPYEYKAGFSPYDVIEEYVRPVRVVEDGRVVFKEALSEPELIAVDGVGLLEAVLTDGLRSLASTVRVPFMTEKTLRYPGHAELMRVFRDTGFFSKDAVEVGGHAVRPLDLTAALLFPRWAFGEGEADVIVLRVTAAGTIRGTPTLLTWAVVDRYDPITRLRSMSRMTAFPAAIAAGLVAGGLFPAGVHPPETVGLQPGLMEVVLRELAARGVNCECTERPLHPPDR